MRWTVALAVLTVGLAVWIVGVPWGGALAGLGLLGAVAAAWLDVGPEGWHVHDSGLSAYGVSETPIRLMADASTDSDGSPHTPAHTPQRRR